MAYAALAVWATWPLASGLSRDVAWDLGDPVLVIWAIAWNCTQLLAILGGDLHRLSTYFDANIFFPAPHALAYSEHFFAQSVQALPVYALTGNAILSYNLLFLSTFVLSGLGAFLFVRSLTRSALAGFVAGLCFAFAPYRTPQFSHLQVLSSQWMPLALYGFHRYFESRRRSALAWAAAALVAQNLSCGYYLLYFSPFAAAYVLAEIAARRLWRDAPLWRDLAIAALAVLAATAPFLLPYAALRGELQSARSLAEVRRYSADVYSYLTAFAQQPLWGRLVQAFPKAEGQLFPGLAAVLLALLGSIPEPATAAGPIAAMTGWRLWTVRVLGGLGLLHAAAAVDLLFVRRLVIDLGPVSLQVSDVTQLLLRAAIAGAAVLVLNPKARARVTAYLHPRGILLMALLAACWLSLGPSPTSLGRPLDLAAPYAFLYDNVPGFEGVRAPSRFWMIGALALAALAGIGATRLARVAGGRILVAAACAFFVAEGVSSPFSLNGAAPIAGFNAPEPRVWTGERVPSIYAAVRQQPPSAVLVELPFGQPDFDVRAMYYSTFHWRKLLNGYSGFYPAHYGPLVARLGKAPEAPDAALAAARAGGATRVLVHERAFEGDLGPRLTAAFRERGATELFRDGTDVLLTVP